MGKTRFQQVLEVLCADTFLADVSECARLGRSQLNNPPPRGGLKSYPLNIKYSHFDIL